MNQQAIYRLVSAMLTALFGFLGASAQDRNLVPNPGFEKYSQCPYFDMSIGGIGIQDYCNNWESPITYTAGRVYPYQYMNECANASQSVFCGVPSNQYGYQFSYEGKGYAQISVSNTNPLNIAHEARNFIGVNLSRPMKTNTKYKVSFMISPGDSNVWNCNKFGLRFFTKRTMMTVISSLNDTDLREDYPNDAHVYSDSVINDIERWYKIEAVFTADNTYSYLIIGNFWKQYEITFARSLLTDYSRGRDWLSSYFIDDVQVIEMSKGIEVSNHKICLGDSVWLVATNMDSAFFWSLSPQGNDTLSTLDSLILHPQHTTTYYLFEKGKGLIDSTTITVFDPSSDILQSDTSFCKQSYISLRPNITADRYQWSTGDTTESIFVFEKGMYSVVLYNENCMIQDSIRVKTCPSYLYIPTAYTPNGDGINDIFTVTGAQMKEFSLEICNRWGEQVFKSERSDFGWDGNYKGAVLSGVYVYKVYYTENDTKEFVTKTGTITLLR